MKHYTTIEQSKELLELGLSPETADMCWITENKGDTYSIYPTAIPWKDYTAKDYYLPCWTAESLLDVLPNFIEHKRMGKQVTSFLHIYYMSCSVLYEHTQSEDDPHYFILQMFENDSEDEYGLTYNVFRMVCWALGNKYIPKIWLKKGEVK